MSHPSTSQQKFQTARDFILNLAPGQKSIFDYLPAPPQRPAISDDPFQAQLTYFDQTLQFYDIMRKWMAESEKNIVQQRREVERKMDLWNTQNPDMMFPVPPEPTPLHSPPQPDLESPDLDTLTTSNIQTCFSNMIVRETDEEMDYEDGASGTEGETEACTTAKLSPNSRKRPTSDPNAPADGQTEDDRLLGKKKKKNKQDFNKWNRRRRTYKVRGRYAQKPK